jgi:hypothetical protein
MNQLQNLSTTTLISPSDIPRHFSQEIKDHQITWDQTSIGEFKLCAYKYYLHIILGYQPRFVSAHLLFGQYFHAGLEEFERAKAKGLCYDECLAESIRRACGESWDKKRNRPWVSDEPTKTRESLLRSIVWYQENYKNDIAQTLILASEKPAVELSSYFETSITSSLSGEAYSLCNYFDRIVEIDNKTFILDYKTTKGVLDENYAKNYSPDNQVSHYTLSGEIVLNRKISGFIVDATQVGATFNRFKRFDISRSQGQLSEWYEELSYWFQCMEICVKTGVWPKNDKSCGYFGGCAYRQICAAQISMRQRLLETQYKIEKWEPLKLRG